MIQNNTQNVYLKKAKNLECILPHKFSTESFKSRSSQQSFLIPWKKKHKFLFHHKHAIKQTNKKKGFFRVCIVWCWLRKEGIETANLFGVRLIERVNLGLGNDALNGREIIFFLATLHSLPESLSVHLSQESESASLVAKIFPILLFFIFYFLFF